MNPLVFSLLLGALAGSAPAPRRTALNVCLAIDRSGAMQGEKLATARAGAVSVLRRLGPADIVSVVAYDDVVQVLLPATRFPERALVENGLRAAPPGGSPALFAGVVKCAAELRKFADGNRMNRIVVVSGGVADLGALGAQLREEGIAVATVAPADVRALDLSPPLEAPAVRAPDARRDHLTPAKQARRAARPPRAAEPPKVPPLPVFPRILIDDNPVGGLRLD